MHGTTTGQELDGHIHYDPAREPYAYSHTAAVLSSYNGPNLPENEPDGCSTDVPDHEVISGMKLSFEMI